MGWNQKYYFKTLTGAEERDLVQAADERRRCDAMPEILEQICDQRQRKNLDQSVLDFVDLEQRRRRHRQRRHRLRLRPGNSGRKHKKYQVLKNFTRKRKWHFNGGTVAKWSKALE